MRTGGSSAGAITGLAGPVAALPLALSLTLALALTAAPAPAHADHGPRIASEAFWVGLRVGPDSALLMGYDLDVYLSDDRAISLGPGATFSVLGKDAPFGQAQDFMLTVDVLRFKVGVNEPNDDWRPYFFMGAGFDYVSLQAATETLDLSPPGDPPSPIMHTLPALHEFEGAMTLGFGGDLFLGGAWAITTMVDGHLRLSGSSRVPLAWLDVALGIRFGI